MSRFSFVLTLVVMLTMPSAFAVEIRGPGDVDALPSAEPAAISPYGTSDLQIGELRLPAGDGPFPVAIVIHGGCWTAGFATARNTAPLASALTDQGIATWNIEYRQVGDEGAGWPGTFQDWAAAADHLRVLAGQHPLDLSRVITVGHSAGGHAALWLAARHRLPANSVIRGEDPLLIRAAVNLDGPADIAGFVGFDAEVCGKPVIAALMDGTPDQVPAHYAQGNPKVLQPAGMAQFLVQVGVLTADDAQAFRTAADTAAAKVEILTPSGANHFDIIAPGNRNGDAVIDWIVRSAIPPAGTGEDRRRSVQSQTDLPRFSYRLDAESAADLLDGGPAFDALAKQVQRDIEATLRDYRIDDRATLASLHATLRSLALLRGDAKAVHDLVTKGRELTDKPSSQLIAGVREDAVASAIAAGDNTEAQRAAFRQRVADTLATTTWAVVGDDLVTMHSAAGLPDNPAMDIGWVRREIDPALAQNGAIDGEAAADLIWLRTYRARILPWNTDLAEVLAAHIAEHRVERPDFWATRNIALDERDDLTPVVVAIWDEGFDPALFPGRVWRNPNEQANGKDDDGNGYIDDLHGIGFDENGDPAISPLIDFDAFYPGREAELRTLSIGRTDLANGRATPAAQAFRERAAAAGADEAAALMEAGLHYSWYAHGTMVADIAATGNPAIRLLNLRHNSPAYKTLPPAPTIALAEKAADNARQSVEYLKLHGARVVNMSFGGEQSYIEAELAKHGIADPTERRELAGRIFAIYRDTFIEIMRDAPEVLFIPAAGNSNDDVGFVQSVPADIDLPNVLAVGATNHAGDSAGFTSYGERVRVYASGDRLEGLLPGGERMLSSGTSFAAPQVANLAGKLFAIDPSLTVAEVIALIVDGAETSTDGRRKLINPRRSVELLSEKRSRAQQASSETSP